MTVPIYPSTDLPLNSTVSTYILYEGINGNITLIASRMTWLGSDPNGDGGLTSMIDWKPFPSLVGHAPSTTPLKNTSGPFCLFPVTSKNAVYLSGSFLSFFQDKFRIERIVIGPLDSTPLVPSTSDFPTSF